MRKFLKNNILEVLYTINEAHEIIRNFIKENNFENAVKILSDCSESAVQLCNIVKSSEGEDSDAVGFFEQYSEYICEISVNVSEVCSGKKLKKELDKRLTKIIKSIRDDIKVKTEIVFLPYKASMWDSFESVWKAANDDPDCDAYVVPIPYYERKKDYSFGEEHYEINEYPDYVPVVHYENYDFKVRKPDVIYIHNPYDEVNFATSVHPFFYSSSLKKYTENLIYIPYFVLDESGLHDKISIENAKQFCLYPGVIRADKVIVQSENMRRIYIETILENFGDTPAKRKIVENKIAAWGSPKFDKVADTFSDGILIPDDWKKIIYKSDGTRKKIIFYNTSINALLNDLSENNADYFNKLNNTFDLFKKNADNVVLLWRPHPLMENTIKSMRSKLLNEYMDIVNEYKLAGWGIYDDTADLNRAIAISDAYYGDFSSVVQLYEKTGKPIMIQNYNVLS